MPAFHITPNVTFEDTNVVGNVYFANFVRWHDDCFMKWLRGTNPACFSEVFRGNQRVLAIESKISYRDSIGATVGDKLKVEMQTNDLQAGELRADFTTQRFDGNGWTPLAIESRCVAVPDDTALLQSPPCLSNTDRLAFVAEFPELWGIVDCNRHLRASELIRLQGKCRERFLVEHAAETLRAIANRELALQTSQVTFRALRDIEVSPADSLRIAMRLTHLRGGRLSVEFDYAVFGGLNGNRTTRVIGTGSQSLCCKRPTDSGLVPAVFPEDMLRGLKAFVDSPELQVKIDDTLEFAMGWSDARHGRAKRSTKSQVTEAGIR